MIPIVMLGINIGVLSSHFLIVFCLTVPCTSEHIPVVYLTTVALRATLLTLEEGAHDMRRDLNHVVIGTQLTHQSLSLFINIFATSLIALKAWCVCVDSVFGKQIVDYALIDDKGNIASR
jgi:hypothetical protein